MLESRSAAAVMAKMSWRNAFFGVAIAVGIFAVIGYYTSEHPPDTGHVRLLNDTGNAVILLRCRDDGCHDFADRSAVAPGGGGDINVPGIGVPNPVLVEEPGTQRRLGCLPIVMPQHREHVVARVSRMVPCKSHYDEHVPWPPA